MTLPVYRINVAPEAETDMLNTYRYIAYDVMQPETAVRYLEGIQATVRSLSHLAGVFALSLSDDIQRLYGPEARTINYKKMTIIYNIVDDIVLVRRVVAGSLIR
jgi:plasmid stabilization system protein ParE